MSIDTEWERVRAAANTAYPATPSYIALHERPRGARHAVLTVGGVEVQDATSLVSHEDALSQLADKLEGIDPALAASRARRLAAQAERDRLANQIAAIDEELAVIDNPPV